MSEQLALTAQPAARVSDPSTSHEAAAKVSKGSDELERLIGNVVAQHTSAPWTAEELADWIVTYSSGRWTYGTVVSAVTRARRRGLIVPAGKALTSRGSQATAYVSAS